MFTKKGTAICGSKDFYLFAPFRTLSELVSADLHWLASGFAERAAAILSVLLLKTAA